MEIFRVYDLGLKFGLVVRKEGMEAETETDIPGNRGNCRDDFLHSLPATS